MMVLYPVSDRSTDHGLLVNQYEQRRWRYGRVLNGTVSRGSCLRTGPQATVLSVAVLYSALSVLGASDRDWLPHSLLCRAHTYIRLT